MTIETKYNIGDEVWWRGTDGLFCGRVCCIVVWGNIYSYQVEFEKKVHNFFEESLFLTKEELLKSL